MRVGRRVVAVAAAFLASACQPLSDLGLDRRPVYLADPIDATTRGRLLASLDGPGVCPAWLVDNGLSFKALADRAESAVCDVRGAGQLVDPPRGDPPLSPARPMMACDLAAAFAVWRRQSVEPAARELLGSEVQRIDHLGVYACRGVGDPLTGRPSAHSKAQAIDIAGFRLANGRRITVSKDWKGQGPEAAFLRRIRSDACRVFGVTLSPDYNAAHADHLHLEAGGGRLCS